jgi:nitric oxide dioxygenase
MKGQVEELVGQHSQLQAYWCYEKPTERDQEEHAYHKEGYVDLPWLQAVVPTRDASFYFCGPVPFMKTIYRALQEWGVPASDVHYEFFGPAGNLELA